MSMIDINARKQVKSILLNLQQSNITNFSYEDTWPTSEDCVIEAIFDALFVYYDDYPEVQLNSEDFPEIIIQRVVIFLDSGLEYKWPLFTFTSCNFPVINKLFNLDKKRTKQFNDFKKHGDFAVWPFLIASDYNNCLKMG